MVSRKGMLWFVLLSSVIVLNMNTVIGGRQCNMNMCFTWRVNLHNLTLICKVNKLQYRVQFINNLNLNVADCVAPLPESFCESYFANGTITQNTTTNETIYVQRGKIDNHLNGKWGCQHASSGLPAKVEVSILILKEPSLNSINNMGNSLPNGTYEDQNKTNPKKDLKASDENCIALYIGITLGSLLSSLVITFLLVTCCKFRYTKFDERISKFWYLWLAEVGKKCSGSRQPWSENCIILCKKVLFTVLIIVVCGVAFLLGTNENGNCGSRILAVLGIAGFIVGVFAAQLVIGQEGFGNPDSEGTVLAVQNGIQQEDGNEEAVQHGNQHGNENNEAVQHGNQHGNENNEAVQHGNQHGNENNEAGERDELMAD